MPKKKCKCPDGIPEWVVTYGDMMSLLLCFFILIAAFSELKKDDEFQKVAVAVKEAMGVQGGVGILPIEDMPLRSMIKSLQTLSLHMKSQEKHGRSNTDSIEGVETTVTKIHEGTKFAIGGHLTFEPGSAVLRDTAKEAIRKSVAPQLRGRNNKIAVRGHAAAKPLPPTSPFGDLRDLSYHRAKAVEAFLVEACGLEPRALVVEARGHHEPLAPRTYTDEAQAANRRVEIILTEAMVDEFHPDPTYSDPDVARGAR